jgi:glycine/D-amino acid oxidase-like deaminating enzyme
MMTRREVLALGLLSTAGCATGRTHLMRAKRARIRPVRVGADREIRTVVGLRPFRPSGFVVRSEALADKLLVHNYGHGGGGITLSWGTAHLVVQLVPAGTRRAAVLGCGAVGLATARLLQERGIEVTIYARELPPETTSNVAGGQWFPFGVYDHDRLTPAFAAQFQEAARFAYRRFQSMVGDWYGVRWITNYWLGSQPPPDAALLGWQSPLRDVLPSLRDLAGDEHPFRAPAVRQFATMLIEPARYLAAVHRDVRLNGGRVVVTELRSLDDVRALEEPVIVNCTGLGTKALFADEELVPVRGQLTFLLPQPEVDYTVLSGPLYMFPRSDGILLGGTFDRGNWSLEPDLAARARILAGHAELFRF